MVKLPSISKATLSKFFVSHFIGLRNTCGQAVHYPLFIISISTKIRANKPTGIAKKGRNLTEKDLVNAKLVHTVQIMNKIST